MADDVTIELDTKNLDKLTKALKREVSKIRVGILAAGARHDKNSNGLTNAQVGAFHEFGTSTLPIRSFLRMPLKDHLPKKLETSNAFNKDVLKQVVDQGKLTAWLKLVAFFAEATVSDAFATGGFGTWIKSDMTHKKNHQTLVETQQLRNSITSEIKE